MSEAEEQTPDPGAEPVQTRAVATVQRAPITLSEDHGYILPTTIDEAFRFAQAVVAGRLAPDTYNNDPSKVMIGVMAAMEAGLPPLYGLRQIAIINGRPVIWGDAAMALVQSKNLIEEYHEQPINVPPPKRVLVAGGDGEEDSYELVPFDQWPIEQWPLDYGWLVTIKRRGQQGEYTGRFTVADAKRAKLWMAHNKKPWLEHPNRMLKIRARAFPLRDGFADALAGLAIREEVEDTHGPDKPVVDASFLDDEPITAAAEEQPEGEKAALFAPEEE